MSCLWRNSESEAEEKSLPHRVQWRLLDMYWVEGHLIRGDI